MKYKVNVIRTSYASVVIEVEAGNEWEAKEVALDEVEGYVFPEGDVYYDADYAEPVDQSTNL